MENLYISQKLHNEDDIIILIKNPKKINVRRPPTPLWENSILSNFFDIFTQFYLYDVYSQEDDLSGKVYKIVKRNIKDYMSFINLYGNIIKQIK